MRTLILFVWISMSMMLLASCGSQDPDVRRGDLFYKNGKYAEAVEAYDRAVQRQPKLLENEKFKENFKNANYYYGGQIELSGSLDTAIQYYERGFDAIPTDAGICDKLAKYFWEEGDFAKSAKYFGNLVEMDSAASDTEQKWLILHQDYYALGYSLFKTGKYQEAIDALQQALKALPKGPMAGQAKSAMEAARQKQAKQK